MKRHYFIRMSFYFSIILALCFTLHIPVTISLAKSPQLQKDKSQYILRIGSIAPAGISYGKYLDKQLKELEKLTDHRVKVKLYLGGVLGDEPAMVKMVQEGELGSTIVNTFSSEEVAPESLVLSLPYLFRDEYEMDFIIEKYESIFAGYARKRGIEILGLFAIGSFQIFSTVPILRPDELRDKKVMSLEKSQFFTEFLRSLSWQSPVPLSISEVAPALNSGKVEVIFGPPAVIVVLGWYPHIRYVVMECFSVAIVGLLVNSDLYQNLPEEVRSTLTKFSRKQRKKMMAWTRRDDEIAMLGLMKRGVNIIRWSPEDMEKMRENAKVFWDFGVGKWYPRKLLDDIIRDLENYRSAKGTAENKKH